MSLPATKLRYAVIGAGISGLSIARMLNETKDLVTIFEKEDKPGGLVRCERVNDVLYHCVGGHVFNSRKKEVLEWFWKHLNKEDFDLATRHAVVSLADGTRVDYPIENHLYQMPEDMRNAVLEDLLHIVQSGYPEDSNFADFLRHRFGETLYREYFAPYNRKIWRRSLENVPLHWLEGKLPMPSVKEILAANIGQVKEMQMVHSTFHYPRMGGSQFVADSLARGLDIRFSTPVNELNRRGDKWIICGEKFDAIIFCGNVRFLPAMLQSTGISLPGIEALQYHGTTSVLCELEPNPYSWIYMPSEKHESHRIICTGNFAASNSPVGMNTATIEFSEEMSTEKIHEQLQSIPFSPRYITHRYTPCTYPVQDGKTRGVIAAAKATLEPHSIFLLGRFAEWEYYNMDAAMEAAMKLHFKLAIKKR